MHLVSTDGHIAFAGLVPAPYVHWTSTPQAGPFSIIIPLDVLKRESKGKTSTVHLVPLDDGKYLLGETVFTPIDGRFPDWRRVCRSPDVSIEAAQYNPDLLARCSAALKAWFGVGAKFAPYLRQHGNHVGIMTANNMTGFCVVMPLKANDPDIKPFVPAPL